MWYHVTIYNEGKSKLFTPNVPYYLRAGEDKRIPRICVTENWKHSLRSIILIKRCQEFFVYATDETPINPIEQRETLLQEKKIRKNCNDYRVLEDGVINKEHWFCESIKMKRLGVIKIPKADHLNMLMGFGFCNDLDVEKYEIVPYKNKTIKQMFHNIKLKGYKI